MRQVTVCWEKKMCAIAFMKTLRNPRRISRLVKVQVHSIWHLIGWTRPLFLVVILLSCLDIKLLHVLGHKRGTFVSRSQTRWAHLNQHSKKNTQRECVRALMDYLGENTHTQFCTRLRVCVDVDLKITNPSSCTSSEWGLRSHKKPKSAI